MPAGRQVAAALGAAFLCAVLVPAALAASASAAGSAPVAPPADPLSGVRVVRLDNGLTLVLRADASRPIVAVQMLYKVGARNETIGITGIAHFIEHMLFRGTTHFGMADVTGVIERAGGEWHGYTTLDCTTFFEAAPKAILPALLRLEAERMTAARMAPAEVDPERGAVFQEYRGYQLDARSDLFDAVGALLFLQHPYRNNTMGWESDLAGITHADLSAFYARYYGPRNAVLAVEGDIDPTAVERQVRELFGPIPARGDDTTIRTVEPPLTGTRRLTMRRPGADPALMVSFLSPPPSQAREYAALLVLDAILGSAKGLSFYRHSGDQVTGAPAGPGSRLGAALAGGPAASIGTSLVPTLYPYQYSLYATTRPGRRPEEIEPVLFGTLRGAADRITPEEIASARLRIAAADDLEIDAPVEVTHEMAYWTALGGLDQRGAILDAVRTITPDEVRAQAATMTEDRAAIGIVLPERDTETSAPPAPGAAEHIELAVARATTEILWPGKGVDAPPPRTDRARTVTIDLPGSARAIVDARPDARTFVLRAALAGTGDAAEARLRAAASALRSDPELRLQLRELGVQLEVDSPGGGRFDERDTLQIEMAGPGATLGSAFLALQPALQRSLSRPPEPRGPFSEDPGERALELLEDAVRSVPAPSGSAAPFRLSVAVVSPFAARGVKPWLVRLAGAAGTIEGRDAASPQVAARASFLPGRRTATLDAISQGRLLIALPGDDDAAAQEAVAWILHHNYGGRLGAKAIGEMGLVYEMESESARRGAPLLYVTMGADPAELARLDSALRALLDRSAGAVTPQEVADYRQFAAGAPIVRLADPVKAARLFCSALLRGEDDTAPSAAAGRATQLSDDRVMSAARRMLDPSRRLTIVVDRSPTAPR
jgi:zinc protease